MFYKIDPKYISQDETPLIKHWYRDAERVCDLFIWQDESNKTIRFQFLYREYILEWTDRTGVQTGQLDRNPGVFSSYQSPTYKLHTNPNQRILNDITQFMNEAFSDNPADDLLEFVSRMLIA